MATFVINEFDPETDPDRPVVGTPIDPGRDDRPIARVSWVAKSKLIAAAFTGVTPEEFLDPILGAGIGRDHVTRPFIMWIVWPAPPKS
jgi:hypothetical protein